MFGVHPACHAATAEKTQIGVINSGEIGRIVHDRNREALGAIIRLSSNRPSVLSSKVQRAYGVKRYAAKDSAFRKLVETNAQSPRTADLVLDFKWSSARLNVFHKFWGYGRGL
jgi:hypothetical protein